MTSTSAPITSTGIPVEQQTAESQSMPHGAHPNLLDVRPSVGSRRSCLLGMNQAEVDARIQACYSQEFAEAERLTVRSAQGRLEP
ncbi:MAG: hypothetical protein JWO11_3212 [Nocardioides sp.]|nr:hypothetical protein [Nocardioides sp.]